MKKCIPSPRIGVISKDLNRPDWSSQTARPVDAIWLDRNENIDPILGEITSQAMSQLSGEALWTYPDLGGLYAKLAKVFGGKSNQYVLAAGSDGAIRAVFEAFVAPGDVVMHSNPTFAMYSVYSRMYAAKAIPFSYVATDIGPALDIEQLICDIRHHCPRLICLPNPDSPTGTVVGNEDLRDIIDVAGEVGAVMLIDEAYYLFYPLSVASWVNDNPHLIVTRTFGKAWGLAGVRVGFAIAHPDMAIILHKVRPMYEIGSLSAAMIDVMLDHSDEVQKSVERILDGKTWFQSQMESLGYQVIPTHGNFMHVAFEADERKIATALLNKVLYRRNFPNTALNGYSRFSVAPRSIMEPVKDMIYSAVKL